MEKGKTIWMDGRLIPWAEATVHVLTYTLHSGVGAIEGIRCYRSSDGRSAIFRLEEHVTRLWQSARILGIESPYGIAEISRACVDTVRANDVARRNVSRQVHF